MKILNSPPTVFTIEMTIIELRAIMKILGDTSHHGRKEMFNLSEDESYAASDVFTTIYNLLHEDS